MSLIRCDNCNDLTGCIRFDHHDLCTACMAERTIVCPKCRRRNWRDDVYATGVCHECSARADTALRDELDEALEALLDAGRGSEIKAALLAAGLLPLIAEDEYVIPLCPPRDEMDDYHHGEVI